MADEETTETPAWQTVDLGSAFRGEPTTAVVAEPDEAASTSTREPVRDFGPEISGEGYNYRVQTGVPSDQAAIEYTAADGSASGVRLPGTSAHTAIIEEIEKQGTDGIPPAVGDLRAIRDEAYLNQLLGTASDTDVAVADAKLREAVRLQQARGVVGPSMAEYMTPREQRVAEYANAPLRQRLLRRALTAVPGTQHLGQQVESGDVAAGTEFTIPIGAAPLTVQIEKATPEARQRHLSPGEEGRATLAEDFADAPVTGGRTLSSGDAEETPRQRLLGIDSEGELLPSWISGAGILGKTAFSDLMQSERGYVDSLQRQVDDAIDRQVQAVESIVFTTPPYTYERQPRKAEEISGQARGNLRQYQNNIRLLQQHQEQLSEAAATADNAETTLSIPLLTAYVAQAQARLAQNPSSDKWSETTPYIPDSERQRLEEDIRTANQVLERMQLDATAMGLTADEIAGAVKAYRERLGGEDANRNQ